jgi:hypothetical protein
MRGFVAAVFQKANNDLRLGGPRLLSRTLAELTGELSNDRRVDAHVPVGVRVGPRLGAHPVRLGKLLQCFDDLGRKVHTTYLQGDGDCTHGRRFCATLSA